MARRAVTSTSVDVLMRDGAVLRADVHAPDHGGARPIVLLRTAYDRTTPRVSQMINIAAALDRGYAVAIQDVRGRFASDGVFQPFRSEIEDGFDTVEWLADQAYCDGSVVMVGSSYSGSAAWLAAVSGAPHLAAIAVHLCAADPRDGWVSQGGAFALAFNLFWATMTIGPEDERRRVNGTWDLPVPYVDASAPWNFKATVGDRIATVLPLCELPFDEVSQRIYVPEFYRQWCNLLANDTDRGADAYWAAISAVERAVDVRCPVLSIGGWYQSFLADAYRGFDAVRWNASSEAAREGSRLVIGPWENSMPAPDNTSSGDIDFGPAAGIELDRMTYDFFDAVLGRRAADSDRVRYFVMGSNTWKSADCWPPSSRTLALYLHADGSLQLTRPGDPMPVGNGSVRTLKFEPADPLPTSGGNTIPGLPQGPRDHAHLDERPDVLVYRSAPLPEPIELAGPVSTTLYVSSAEHPVDWTACLSYLDRRGRLINICDGIRRVLQPSDRTRVVIDMLATAIQLPAGTVLHLRIGASNFPRFDVASGGGTGVRSVHHDAPCASFMVLTPTALAPPEAAREGGRRDYQHARSATSTQAGLDRSPTCTLVEKGRRHARRPSNR